MNGGQNKWNLTDRMKWEMAAEDASVGSTECLVAHRPPLSPSVVTLIFPYNHACFGDSRVVAMSPAHYTSPPDPRCGMLVVYIPNLEEVPQGLASWLLRNSGAVYMNLLLVFAGSKTRIQIEAHIPHFSNI